MGFLDDAKDKLEDVVEEHGSEIAKGLDKAADLAAAKVGHSKEIHAGVDKVKHALIDDNEK